MDITNLDSVFLGISLPLRVAYRLSLLDDLFSDGECDYGNSSFPHITVLGPRPSLSMECIAQVEAIVASVSAQPLLITEYGFFTPNRIVGRILAPWLQDLHQNFLRIEGLSKGDPTYEGDRYNIHVAIGKTTNPEPHVQHVQQLMPLPMVVQPPYLTLFGKTKGQSRFSEVRHFAFLS
jgi:hypothetical protein